MTETTTTALVTTPLTMALAPITSNAAPAIGYINQYDATAGSRTPTLPVASLLQVGARLIVQKRDSTANVVTLNCTTGETFADDGSTSRVLRQQGDQLELQVVNLGEKTNYWKVVGASASRVKASPPRPITTEATSTTVIATIAAGAFATSITGGVAAATVGSPAGKLNLIGAQALVEFYTGANCWAPAWKTADNGTIGAAAPSSSFGIDFMVSGTRYVEVLQIDYTGQAVQVWVDGKKLSDLPVAAGLTDNQYNTIRIDFGAGNTGPHRVRLMVVWSGLGAIWTEPAGVVWAPPKAAERLLVLGDSLTAGFSFNTGGELGTWLHRFANIVGIRDYWNDGIIGSGPNYVMGVFPNFKSRAITEALPANADVYIVGSYINDVSHGRTAAQIAADYATIFATLKTAPSSPLIIGWSGFDPAGVNGPDFVAINTAVKAACVAAGAAWIDGHSGEVVNAQGVTVLTNGPFITAANKSLYINTTDNVHPNDFGHKYLARRMSQAYLAIRGLESLCDVDTAFQAPAVVGAGATQLAAIKALGLGVVSNGDGTLTSLLPLGVDRGDGTLTYYPFFGAASRGDGTITFG